MKDFFFGYDNASRTLLVFSIVFFTFVVIPLFYQPLTSSSLDRIQKKTFLLDWRFWIPMLVYSILLGFRYDYSYDWNQYRYTFEYINNGILYRDDTEKGYLFINKCLGLCGFNFYSIFILEAITYISSFFFLFKDNRKYLLFVLPLVYMQHYSNCLNISRQYFAMSMLFIAYRYLLDEKKIVYLLLGLVACSIHSSAYIWLILFWCFQRLNNIKINVTYVFIACIVSSIVIYCFKTPLYDALASMSNIMSSKSQYSENQILDIKYQRDNMQFSMFVVKLARILMYLYLFKIQNALGLFKDRPILKNYVLIGLVMYPVIILMGTHEIFSRMLYYVSFMADIGWGILVYNYFFNCLNFKKVWTLGLVTICTFQIPWAYYSMIISGFFNNTTNLFIIYR